MCKKQMMGKPANFRRNQQPQKQMNKLRIFTGLAIVIVLAAAAVVAIGSLTGRFDIFGPSFEIVANGNSEIIKVPANGNLQAAINRAKSGDIIELVAGATYFGEIVLPNKPLIEYVTIRTSAADKLPENQRVGPAQANLMARILTRGDGKPAVSTAAGAHHYRFVGIEFAPNNADYIYNLVLFGADQKRTDVPHHLEIDRSYIHHFAAGKTRRGIAVNSESTTVKNSYIEGFAYPNEETQGIAGWTGTKDLRILNNYIEGGAENILFGGSDPMNADLIPANIEVRGNHLNKPAAWKGKATLKALFEIKNAKNVQFVGNYLENNWSGSAFRITVRNQDGGAPFSTIEDVLIKDNVINGSGEGLNILGKDDTYPSQTIKRLTITNNVFMNLGGAAFEGSGYFIQIANGETILIANNTVFNTGNIATFYGDMPRDFLFRDNIVGHGAYGIHGLGDMKGAGAMFQNNLFVNSQNVPRSDFSFPDGNMNTSDYKSVGFTDLANNDHRLAVKSRYKGKGAGKTDLGSNIHAAAIMKQ